MSDTEMKDLIRQYIKESLTLDVKSYRGYYDENETFEIGLFLEGEEISRISIY